MYPLWFCSCSFIAQLLFGCLAQPLNILFSLGFVVQIYAQTPQPTLFFSSVTDTECGESMVGSTSGYPNLVGNPSGDALFDITLETDSVLTVKSCGSQFDTYIRVFDGDLVEQLCSCDDCGNCDHSRNSELDCTLSSGSYVVVLEGYANEEGFYSIEFLCTEPEAVIECVDSPLLWEDSVGSDCGNYFESRWCNTPENPDYAVDGIDADAACCACGGGSTGDVGAVTHTSESPPPGGTEKGDSMEPEQSLDQSESGSVSFSEHGSPPGTIGIEHDSSQESLPGQIETEYSPSAVHYSTQSEQEEQLVLETGILWTGTEQEPQPTEIHHSDAEVEQSFEGISSSAEFSESEVAEEDAVEDLPQDHEETEVEIQEISVERESFEEIESIFEELEVTSENSTRYETLEGLESTGSISEDVDELSQDDGYESSGADNMTVSSALQTVSECVAIKISGSNSVIKGKFDMLPNVSGILGFFEDVDDLILYFEATLHIWIISYNQTASRIAQSTSDSLLCSQWLILDGEGGFSTAHGLVLICETADGSILRCGDTSQEDVPELLPDYCPVLKVASVTVAGVEGRYGLSQQLSPFGTPYYESFESESYVLFDGEEDIWKITHQMSLAGPLLFSMEAGSPDCLDSWFYLDGARIVEDVGIHIECGVPSGRVCTETIDESPRSRRTVAQTSAFTEISWRYPSDNTVFRTVKVGSLVRWIWRDDMAHTVTCTSSTAGEQYCDFDSGYLKGINNATFEYVFQLEGVYEYHCKVHPESMRGHITVES